MGAIALLCLLVVGTFASPIQDDDVKPVYRLPTSVVPSAYVLDLIVEEDAFLTKTFQGVVSITVTAVNATSEIKLNAKRLTITHLTVTETTANLNTTLNVKGYSLNELTEIFTISLEKELEKDHTYILQINYVGDLADDDMYGFYISTYNNTNGETQYVASTQFENIEARRAFPSFDEPFYKATFYVSITAPPDKNVLLNTPQEGKDQPVGNLIKKQFKKTPIMSTYLLAFVVSDFTNLPSKDGTVTLWARPGTEKNRKIAVEYAAKLLAAMSDWTNIPFSEHGIGKMDVVAIPDFAPGAMENWGLVTYRERLLIDDGDETALVDRGSIATVIAHEFSHSWFGDLVTADWWCDIWLNEGFATYFEYHLTHLVEPDFNLDKKFLIDVIQPVLQEDALYSCGPVSSKGDDVNTPAEISAKMDDITYDKGGSVIRMFRDFIGEENFHEGLQAYLVDNKYKNASPAKLWTYFKTPDSLPANLDVIMENWIFKPGFPVVHVMVVDGGVELMQERFLVDDDQTDDTKWYVPISYVTATLQKDGKSAQAWLGPDKDQTISYDTKDWIVINYKHSGFYRVNYEETLWRNILKVLNNSSTIDDIDETNRAQIVDDLFNLARVGRVTYNFLFEFIEFLKFESSYYVWHRAFDGFNFILNKFANTELADKINERITTLFGKLRESVPIKDIKRDNFTYTLTQSLAWEWACRLNITECVEYSVDSFINYKANSIKPPADFKYFVYCTALQFSSDPSDWDFLWNEYPSASPAEQVAILNSLGCSRNNTIIEKYLNLTITDTRIRKQDARTAYLSVFEKHPENVRTAYEFLKNNLEAVSNYYKGMSALSRILNALGNTLSEEDVDDLKKFSVRDDLDDDFKVAASQALEAAEANSKWRKKYEPELLQLFGVSSAAKINAGFCLLMLILSLSRLF